MSASIASTLIEIIATAQQELGKIGGAAGSSKKGGKKVAAAKKESSRKGRPTPHGDFTKKILEEHKDEKEAFIAERAAKAAAGELLYAADDAAVKKGKHAAGDAYTEEEAKKGAHLNFIAAYKSQHQEEYKAFEAAWREAHPKEATSANESEAESAEGSVGDADAASTSSKPKRTMSEKQKANMKADREKSAAARKAAKAGGQEIKDVVVSEPLAQPVAQPKPAPSTPVAAAKPAATPAAPKKAKKADAIVTPVAIMPEPVIAPVVAAPVAAPVVAAPVVAAPEADEEEANELLAFKYAGANYLRIGTRRADGNHIWATGDLWASNKGAKGKYIGCLSEDSKSIDRTAEEPELD